MLHFKRFFYFALLVFYLPLAQAYSQEEIKTTVNLAGKQRMLTQKMSKEVVMVSLGINKASALADLKKTHDLFDKTLKGLRHGDAELGLVPAEGRTIKSRMKKVDKLWADFAQIIQAILSAGSVTPEQLAKVAENNEPLLKAMHALVGVYQLQARAGSEQDAGAAIAVNISGRQRMLTQKMTKEFLLILANHEPESNREKLQKTTALFDKSLKNLDKGNAELDLPAAPNSDVRNKLKAVDKAWQPLYQVMQNMINTSHASEAEIDYVLKHNLPLLKASHAVVLALVAA